MNVGSEKLATGSKVIVDKSQVRYFDETEFKTWFFNCGQAWQFRDQEFFVLFNATLSRIYFRLFKEAKIMFQFSVPTPNVNLVHCTDKNSSLRHSELESFLRWALKWALTRPSLYTGRDTRRDH